MCPYACVVGRMYIPNPACPPTGKTTNSTAAATATTTPISAPGDGPVPSDFDLRTTHVTPPSTSATSNSGTALVKLTFRRFSTGAGAGGVGGGGGIGCRGDLGASGVASAFHRPQESTQGHQHIRPGIGGRPGTGITDCPWSSISGITSPCDNTVGGSQSYSQPYSLYSTVTTATTGPSPLSGGLSRACSPSAQSSLIAASPQHHTDYRHRGGAVVGGIVGAVGGRVVGGVVGGGGTFYAALYRRHLHQPLDTTSTTATTITTTSTTSTTTTTTKGPLLQRRSPYSNSYPELDPHHHHHHHQYPHHQNPHHSPHHRQPHYKSLTGSLPRTATPTTKLHSPGRTAKPLYDHALDQRGHFDHFDHSDPFGQRSTNNKQHDFLRMINNFWHQFVEYKNKVRRSYFEVFI